MLRLYPHLKITREKFPRLLATRKIEADEAEYFGAFLPEFSVRFMLEFLNRTFRLRSCTIEIDGSFNVPCPMFYTKRCVAPCVENLCNADEYAEQVELLRLFLRADFAEFEKILQQKIEHFSELLEFEKAAHWRDVLQSTLEINEKQNWRLSDTVDTYAVEENDAQITAFLVTQRGRKTLGKRTFVFEKQNESVSPQQILFEILSQFYQFYAPAEIRVPFDFPQRKTLEKSLRERAGSDTKITIVKKSNEKKLAVRALERVKFEYELRQIKSGETVRETGEILKGAFSLEKKPNRIEAFDVAHISGTDFVAGKSVWENGKFLVDEYEFWFSGESSELAALAQSVKKRFAGNEQKLPDLLLIDGGKAQLQVVIAALKKFNERKFAIVSAVKPPRKHGEVSHFLNENGEKIELRPESKAFRLLQNLRDDAHELCNRVHRQKRDAAHFYEFAAILPSLNENERRKLLRKFGSLKKLKEASENDFAAVLNDEAVLRAIKDLQHFENEKPQKVEPLIVPIRFDDADGEARDLQPLSLITMR